MKFLLAPDSFKESMSALTAAKAMQKGIKKVFPDAETILLPVADGGEGTMDVLVYNLKGNTENIEVCNALGKKITAKIGYINHQQTAIIEMAQAAGLEQISSNERNPLISSTYGVGEMVLHALNKDVKEIIFCLGGSATNDGGFGFLQALGGKFFDAEVCPILDNQPSCLDRLQTVDLDAVHEKLKKVKLTIASDVKNPLLGEYGATYTFGKQKGATSQMLQLLEKNLCHFANCCPNGEQLATFEGSGAAGGLGFALQLLGAKVKSGIDLVLTYSNFADVLLNVDYVFTGEGSIDEQTRYGKTPYGVAKWAKKKHKQTIIFAGSIKHGDHLQPLYDAGVIAIVPILQGVQTLPQAIKTGPINLQQATITCCQLLKANK